MYNNENVLAQAESKPKLSGGAFAAWLVALVIFLPGVWGAAETGESAILAVFSIIAAVPALIGVAVHLAMLNGAKKTLLIATERCIYFKTRSAVNYSGDGAVELPYDSIVNIRVSPEGFIRSNGDMVILYLPSSMLTFRNITNAPQIVMTIKAKVEEIKGPMPPYGYAMVMPAAYGVYPPPQMYGQPYAPPYVQPNYVQPNYARSPYQPVQPNYVPPPRSYYGPVRPEYQYPSQNVYADVRPAPARTEYAAPQKPPQTFDVPERPAFDPETGERINYDGQNGGGGL